VSRRRSLLANVLPSVATIVLFLGGLEAVARVLESAGRPKRRFARLR